MAKLAGRLKAPPKEPGCCATAEEGAEGSVLGGWFHDRRRERMLERESKRFVARSDESGESIVENERTSERTNERNETNYVHTYEARKVVVSDSSPGTEEPATLLARSYFFAVRWIRRIVHANKQLEIDVIIVMFRGNTSAA